ncbi:MAG: hypothetical protein AB7N65_17915 [Vicinamibacterales bacterium]
MAHLAKPLALRRPARVLGLAAAGVMLAGIYAPVSEAHKAITSKYNYTEHIFPILRERCARCHFEGGPTPMSLVTYQDAVPWAESMREQLVGQKMPPWYADPTGPSVKGGHTLTTRELDMLVTWATGGTPNGPIDNQTVPAVPPPVPWHAGPPDHKVKMPKPHELPAGIQEDEVEFTLPTGLTEEKWVKAVDLQPGEPSMVRDAVVAVQNGPVLSLWVPGHDAIAAPSGTGFKLAPDSVLTLKVHYKKSWLDEQNSKSDQSTIGLYFTDAPLSGKSIEAVQVKGPETTSPTEATSFAGTLKTGTRVLALRPSFDQAYREASVDAVLPNNRRVTLMKLRAPQPLWYRRYWLAEPIELPAGTKLEVKALPASVDEFAPPVQKRYPLQVSLDVVAQ